MAKQKVGDFYVDSYPTGAVVTETIARTDFNAARTHAITLINIHDEKTGGGKGRPPQELEALKRSALILAITAWESFVEDTVTFELDKKLKGASKATELQSIFNGVAAEWLDPERSPKRHGPDLAKWTGEEWKVRVRESLALTLETFHTPNTENTNRLFKRYLGIQIQDSWSWNAMSAANAQKKLDDLIKLRGRVVHRGKTLHPASAKLPDVKRNTVVDALNLLYSLVSVTESALNVAPSVGTGA
ncbi:conserved hypothetical protein [sediment metagenome]|uniref:RiboL-PSP-HEPN domain-containing protein n=1 Tax=sediment metagenome TaxID=749907 RepID=D9PIS4_9ZZZZ